MTEAGSLPSQAYLDFLDRGVLEEHQAALRVVRQWVRFCPYPEWVLLELPDHRWGALWHQGYGDEYTDRLLEGDYRLLACVADTLDDVMHHMAKNLMFSTDAQAKVMALQRRQA